MYNFWFSCDLPSHFSMVSLCDFKMTLFLPVTFVSLCFHYLLRFVNNPFPFSLFLYYSIYNCKVFPVYVQLLCPLVHRNLWRRWQSICLFAVVRDCGPRSVYSASRRLSVVIWAGADQNKGTLAGRGWEALSWAVPVHLQMESWIELRHGECVILCRCTSRCFDFGWYIYEILRMKGCEGCLESISHGTVVISTLPLTSCRRTVGILSLVDTFCMHLIT